MSSFGKGRGISKLDREFFGKVFEMPSVPTWRQPIYKREGNSNGNWALEIHRPSWTDDRIPKCQAIAKSTGEKCRGLAVRGSGYCKRHGGIRFLEKRIAEGKSARVYAAHNIHSYTKNTPGARTTKAKLSDHIHTRKHNNKLYERFYESEGLFMKSVSNSVLDKYQTLSKSKKLRFFLLWEQKNIDPRSYTEALKALLNG